jgi:hypothetical protein
METRALEGESPVTENSSAPSVILSNTAHVKRGVNLRRPRRKAKY